MKQNLNIMFVLSGALLLAANSANAATVYDNNISVLNINMLTDEFMSYTDYSRRMSRLFKKTNHMYGTMTRVDEYGDNGSTVQMKNEPFKQKRTFISNLWLNANHLTEDMHYGKNISQTNKFNIATVGATFRSVRLNNDYGRISFGGFASYINTKTENFNSNGDTFGLFANYKYHNLTTRALVNIGSLNNNSDGAKFNNSWVNAGLNLSGPLKLDETFFMRPGIYMTYTYVSSDDLYINGKYVTSDNYHFFNVAPSLTFIKEIANKWYGSLSAKYVAHFGGKHDINIDGVREEGLYLENHTDIGIDVEHDYKQWTFIGKIHKQLGGIDGLSFNINAKYAF